ncbi:MAG: hypothetical protein ACI9YT_002078 [Halobacteriales archaeon]|jgi:hypothetical protein
MGNLGKAALLAGGGLLAGWIAWGLYSGRSTERVPYERRDRFDGVEIRHYPRTVLVETAAADQAAAFRRLFEYISGANERNESVAMTAPVATEGGQELPMTAPVLSGDVDAEGGADDRTRMAFYLPPAYDPETAPVPTDPAVRLVVEPPKTVAASGFSWYATDGRVARRRRKLLSALADRGVEPRGEPFLLRYDDPWTPPFMRRNEVAVDVVDLE